MNKLKQTKGITLIALIITIIVLLILAGVTLAMVMGENGIIGKASKSKSKSDYSVAAEQINLKITNLQILKYAEEHRMPTLKEVADNFCEDDDFDKVIEKTETASLEKIANDNPMSIIVKLKAYTYEFEINKDLQLASIDGTQIASNTGSSNGDNVNSWLACIGNPNSKGYTSENLNELFADDTLINDLFNSEEAINYFCKSKNIILPEALKNENLVKLIIQKNNLINLMLSDNDILELICKSSYANYFDKFATIFPNPVDNSKILSSTKYDDSYLPQYGFGTRTGYYWCTKAGDTTGYLGYNIDKKMMVYKFTLANTAEGIYNFKTFYLQCLDGNNWVNASSVLSKAQDRNVQTYYVKTAMKSTQWRLKGITGHGNYLACNDLKFYGFPYNDE